MQSCDAPAHKRFQRAPVTPKVVHLSSDQISKYMWMVEEPSSHTILPERRPSVDPPKNNPV